MYRQPRTLTLAAVVALGMTNASGLVAADPVSQSTADARQETLIRTAYALDPYLRANDIQVSVEDGRATLTGNVQETINKLLARQIARAVHGIKEVDDRIVMQADYVPPMRSSARSYGEMLDYATVNPAVKSKLMCSWHVDGLAKHVALKLSGEPSGEAERGLGITERAK